MEPITPEDIRLRRRGSPLQIPVHVSSSTRPDFVASSVNISEGGMALFSSAILHVGDRLILKLTLPDTASAARINCEVSWADETGRVGLEFVQVPATVAEQQRNQSNGPWEVTRTCVPKSQSNCDSNHSAGSPGMTGYGR